MAKTFTSGEVLTASDVNVNLATYMPMIPTSVSGTGVTYSTTTGLISLSGVSSASINGVFTSTYRRYEIHFYAVAASTATFTMRLRASGTDDSNSVYDVQSLASAGNSATPVAANSLAGTSWPITSTTASAVHYGKVTVQQPATATLTVMNSEGFTTLNPATAAATTAITNRFGLHRNSTAFDGFSFIMGTGTLTGTIKVFAYN